jgi:hypothetical protein
LLPWMRTWRSGGSPLSLGRSCVARANDCEHPPRLALVSAFALSVSRAAQRNHSCGKHKVAGGSSHMPVCGGPALDAGVPVFRDRTTCL